MSNVFFKSQFTSARKDLIQTTSLGLGLAPFYPQAFYDFGVSEASLTSVDGDRTLEQLKPSAVTYTSNSVVFSSEIGEGLRSDMTDKGDFSVIVTAISTGDAGIMPVLGNWRLPVAGLSSWGIYTTPTGLTLSVRAAGLDGAMGLANIGSVVRGSQYSIAVSYNKTTKKFHAISGIASSLRNFPYTIEADYVGNGGNIHLGNAGYVRTGGTAGTIEVKEAIFYNKALSATDLQKVLLEQMGRNPG